MIRRLCALLVAENVYRNISVLLQMERDLPFASTMVQALNLILLTAPELTKCRNELKGMLGGQGGGSALFCTLYKSWCHSAGATLSLCLLAGVNHHCCDVIGVLGSLDINVSILMEIDRLVSLLESPIYSGLRLKLLEPAQNPALCKAYYGILAILPQSNAFNVLKARIQSMPSMELLQLNALMQQKGSGGGNASSGWGLKGSLKDGGKEKHNADVNFAELLNAFQHCQQRHIDFQSSIDQPLL